MSRGCNWCSEHGTCALKARCPHWPADLPRKTRRRRLASQHGGGALHTRATRTHRGARVRKHGRPPPYLLLTAAERGPCPASGEGGAASAASMLAGRRGLLPQARTLAFVPERTSTHRRGTLLLCSCGRMEARARTVVSVALPRVLKNGVSLIGSNALGPEAVARFRGATAISGMQCPWRVLEDCLSIGEHAQRRKRSKIPLHDWCEKEAKTRHA